MKLLQDCKLYTFVDATYLNGRKPETVAAQLCEGGADLIQFRAKNAAPDEIRRQAKTIMPVTRRANAGLVINDYPALAQEIGAELCHLGQEDFFGAGYSHVSQVKTNYPNVQIGLSTHSPEQARRAVDAGADYIAVGPVYATPTKPNAIPVTLELVRWAAVHVQIPWFAIGGITLSNLDQVLAAGARRICVVSAILNADNISKTCAAIRRQILE